MTKPDIVQFMGMSSQLTDRLEPHFTLHQIADASEVGKLSDDALGKIRGIALSGGDRLDEASMALFPALEIVSCNGVGYDGIDAGAAVRRGIMVTHTPGVLDDEVANTTIALTLAVTRRIVALDRYVRQGRWEKEGNAPLTLGLAGKHVGIAGMGRIGRTIADKLAAFNCDISYFARNKREDVAYRYYSDLRKLAHDCDILIVIVPGGAATRNLIDSSIIDALGPEGTLINVSRGSVVDEPALVDALTSGRLGAAGLDVFASEPHVPDALLELDNVVLLPHIGSATRETRKAMADLAVENLVSWFANKKAITPVPECRENSQ
jgi:lactate dehydrogenase-like 2-hydroxyacid dehydrogenase